MRWGWGGAGSPACWTTTLLGERSQDREPQATKGSAPSSEGSKSTESARDATPQQRVHTHTDTHFLSGLCRPPGAALYIRESCDGTPEVAAIMQPLWAKSEHGVNHPPVPLPA